MRVTIVGAGPAGLYLAILLKKGDSAHDVTVLERNPPDATFGWGVVFSEETLGALRDADNPTYTEITDTFARWDRIDIRYRGRLLRSRGHAFSAIARRQLLAILQARARELGVDLRFGVEVAKDPDPGADLLVAADGVNSLLRRERADVFGTKVVPQGGTYAWFGTDLVLDAFTFVFQDTPHGLIQVHAYPFDEHTSTFIVEAPEPAWRGLGLHELDEQQSMRLCEELFAETLQGHRLMSNRSIWTRFQRVSNASWHHGRTVLVGDAAHTAHFSIGSGTKLAMEDAISLANALLRRGASEAALVDYELERQPVVERLQQAADDSAAYFGRVARYAGFEPLQFAFNLLTRSGRISHANLMLRDPAFVRVLDAWFAGSNADVRLSRTIAPPPMFAPLRLGGLELRNRMVTAGPDAGGAGLVLTELVAVSEDGRVTPETPMQVDPEVVSAAHVADAKLAVLLGHAGRRGSTRPPTHGADLPLREGGWPLLSASAIPYAPLSATPKAMDAQDIERVTADFAAAARRAEQAGVDMLILDFAHGYLVASFLSPLTNRRTDAYGADRLRFPRELIAAVRGVWHGPLGVRLTITDWARRGTTVDDGIATARELGADLVHVVAGQTVAEGRPDYRRGFLTGLADRVRSEARVPTIVAGYLTTPDEVNTIVGAGRADLCVLELPDADVLAA